MNCSIRYCLSTCIVCQCSSIVYFHVTSTLVLLLENLLGKYLSICFGTKSSLIAPRNLFMDLSMFMWLL